MNKSELISAMAEKSGLTKVDCKKSLESFICTVTEELKKGEKITLVGFGTFSISRRAARIGRNPRKADEVLHIEAKNVAKFSAGNELKEAVK